MLFQIIVGADWIIGVGLMFGLALVMTFLTQKSSIAFAVWLMIFSAFVVVGGLLPLWVLVLCIIFVVISLYIEMKSGIGGVV